MPRGTPSPSEIGRKRRIVTALTLVRAPLVFVATAMSLANAFRPGWTWLALAVVLMVVSAVTDLFDGRLARKWDVTSRFGALADPLMDKVFFTATLPAATFIAIRQGATAHAAFLLLLDVVSVLRDQWVSFLRSVGSAYGADVRASWAGKFRTAYAFPVIIAVHLYLGLVALGIRDILPRALALSVFGTVVAAEAVLLAVTVFTGWTYTLRYRPYLRRAASEK